jgi:hypothetical protein
MSDKGKRDRRHLATIPLTCTHCGDRVVYVRTEVETRVYWCERHGLFMLPPDGVLRRDMDAPKPGGVARGPIRPRSTRR